MSRPDGYLLPDHLDANDVVREVARGFRVTPEEIMGESRARHITVARSCAMAVIRKYTRWSWPVIADFFARDQQTVRIQVRKIMEDPQLARGVDLVVEELLPAPRLFDVDEGVA